jgi:hypothetical protein
MTLVETNVTKKILKYKSKREEFPGILVPTRTLIPQWYKDAEVWVDGKIGVKNHALKTCAPFLDALTIGYVFVITDDLLVEYTEFGEPFVTWRNGSNVLLSHRPSDNQKTLPIPLGCNPRHFAWVLQGALELPKGYSALLTHPFNRVDLPFVTLTGVLDDAPISPGNLPFFFKEGFTGVIEKGTPFAQVIPFKREDWKAEEDDDLLRRAELAQKKSTSVLKGWYKKNVWKKKLYD